MAKSSREQIEQDVNKILIELQKNSNYSINEIAKKLGFSRQKVWRIIKDLEEDKTVWGYTAIVDDNKIGRKRYFILLNRANIPFSEEKMNIIINREFRPLLEENDVRLDCSFFVNGIYDGILCVTAKNITQVKMFIEKMNNTLGGMYMSDINILEVLFTIERDGFDNPNIEELKEYFHF